MHVLTEVQLEVPSKLVLGFSHPVNHTGSAKDDYNMIMMALCTKHTEHIFPVHLDYKRTVHFEHQVRL